MAVDQAAAAAVAVDTPPDPPVEVKRELLRVPESVTVGELAEKMRRKSGEVIKALLELGVMATMNEILDPTAAKLVAELPLAPAVAPEALWLTGHPVADLAPAQTGFLATSPRVGLRPPAWEDLTRFEQWAQEPLLEQMVGSNLLYVCRHLGAYHPDFTPLVLNDPTALTLLVQPLAGTERPVGYVRLYNIDLIEQFAFLETAVAELRALRKGWGIEASRLLLAYAMDALGLCRVEAKVYAYNLLSINSLERNGFIREGVLRQARSYDGQRWDILLFSILREEMAEQRKADGFPYMGFWGDAGDASP
jgi:RimJ/RimL family protein N-acetyltransferase